MINSKITNTNARGSPNMVWGKRVIAKIPIKIVQATAIRVNGKMYRFFLPDLSIITPNSGEKRTRKKLAAAFAYEINVLAI
jgi:hypothetical protein